MKEAGLLECSACCRAKELSDFSRKERKLRAAVCKQCRDSYGRDAVECCASMRLAMVDLRIFASKRLYAHLFPRPARLEFDEGDLVEPDFQLEYGLDYEPLN